MSTPATPPRHLLARIFGFILPVLVLAISLAIATALLRTAPQATRVAPPRQARLVEVEPLRRTDEQVAIRALGTVRPARETLITPQVSGRIIETGPDFLPGGLVRAGDLLVAIDPADYHLALRQAESALARARADAELERGRQAVAEREVAMLGGELSDRERTLVLRTPQREQAEAALAQAEAQVAQARLDLDRTRITAPFDALVHDRRVDLGQSVTPATTVATLTGTETYWVIASLPVEQLAWIEFPDAPGRAGSPARILPTASDPAAPGRPARVLRLLGALEEQGRLAQVLVEINHPLTPPADAPASTPLLLGDYVRVEIAGRALPGVFALPPATLRGRDRVWIMNADNQLDIRPVDILYRGADRIYIGGGLEEGERLITSDLPAAVAGMPLRLAGAPPP